MPTMIPDDAQLLQSYTRCGSSAAFTELVQRHLPLVYHAARRHTPHRHLAEDIAQEVFTLLARKASALTDHPSLVGWLYSTTRRTALHMIRRETNRRSREQTLAALDASNPPSQSAPDWARLEPLLDESLHALKPADRDALLLRFFENHAFSEIGRRLALSEDAARMRVDRALEKLRTLLQSRGFSSTSAVLSLALTTHSSAALPTGLVTTISTSALASASLSPGLLATTAKLLLMTKVQLTAASGLLALLLTATLWQTHRQNETQRALATATTLNNQLARTSSSLKTQLASTPAGIPAALITTPMTPEELARKNRMLSGFRSTLDRQYAALFRRLHLSSADLAALKTLLIERNSDAHDASVFAVKEGLTKPTNTELGQLIRDSQSLITEKMRTLLGEESFAYLQNYEHTAPARNILGPLFKDLRALSLPLSDTQEDQLVDLVHQTRNGHAGYPQLPDAALESARSFLSKEQFAEFQSQRNYWADHRRRAEINRAAAIAGKLTLTSQSAKDYPASRADTSP